MLRFGRLVRQPTAAITTASGLAMRRASAYACVQRARFSTASSPSTPGDDPLSRVFASPSKFGPVTSNRPPPRDARLLKSYSQVENALQKAAIHGQWALHDEIWSQIDRRSINIKQWNNLLSRWAATKQTQRMRMGFEAMQRNGTAPNGQTYATIIIYFSAHERDVHRTLTYWDQYKRWLSTDPNSSDSASDEAAAAEAAADGSNQRQMSGPVANRVLQLLALRSESVIEVQQFFDLHFITPPPPGQEQKPQPDAPTQTGGAFGPRATANTISYNILLGAYARRGRWDRVRQIWDVMCQHTTPAEAARLQAAATAAAGDVGEAGLSDTTVDSDKSADNESVTVSGGSSISPDVNSFRTLISAVTNVDLKGGRHPKTSPDGKTPLQEILPFLEAAGTASASASASTSVGRDTMPYHLLFCWLL